MATAEAGFDAARIRATLPPLTLDERRTLPREERDYLAFYGIDFAATLRGVEHWFGAVDHYPHRLAAHVWQPSQPIGTFFVLHGYFDHVGIYRHLIRHLLEARYAVVAFDLPGHGLSTGDPAHIDSFDDYVSAFDRCLCAVDPSRHGRWHVVGQSTGAAIAMEWALANGYTKANAPFGTLTLLAPLVRPANWPTVRFAYYLGRHILRRRVRLFRENSGDPGFLEFLRDLDPLQARTLPMAWINAMVGWMRRFPRHTPSDLQPLVVQGTGDTTVDWRYNLSVIEQLFDTEIVMLPRARHHLVHEAPAIRSQVFAALLAHAVAGHDVPEAAPPITSRD
jgi:alpha-beta hydrolase superfamily lysophospholipase